MFLGAKGCCWGTGGLAIDSRGVVRQLGGVSLPAGALDDSERVHMRILQTIYRQLTRSRLGCPRYGAHWEELGFQGRAGSTPVPGDIPKSIQTCPGTCPFHPSSLRHSLCSRASPAGLPWACSSTSVSS